ncbi:MAG: hypothetical protein JW726_20070 [Anaerolineales bacterium]|nr:hypothetical protein [Anaerolineales bacterium]
MTTQMVRKQIYISRRQEQLLKHLSQALGVSEAEFIRQALDKDLSGEVSRPVMLEAQAAALDEFIALARSKRDLTGEPIRWQRAELYAERENRLLHQVAEGEGDADRTD